MATNFERRDCAASSWNIQELLAGLDEEQLEKLLEALNLPLAFNLLSAYAGVGNVASEVRIPVPQRLTNC